jgi:hypothetical protein
MLPTLWPGDLLTIQSRQPEQVDPGDILLYARRDRFFIHRIVSKSLNSDDKSLIARGDCMPENDPPIQGRDLLGKITEVHRAGSVFVPARERSPFRRIVAYLLCHWGLLRRIGLRCRGRRRNNSQVEGALVEAAS